MTPMTPNVAFIGRAGAGKTTAAEMLTKYFGYRHSGPTGSPEAPVAWDSVEDADEIQRLRIEGFLIARVNAPRHVRLVRLKATGRLPDEALLDTPAEDAQDAHLVDYEVDNTHSPDRLLDQLTRLLNKEQR